MSLVGRDVFETLIKDYTEKQWGRSCKELPASIIQRLPVRLIFDNNYFNDRFQGIPEGGYNLLINKLLEGTECIMDCDYLDNRYELNDKARRIIYSGSIDLSVGDSFQQMVPMGKRPASCAVIVLDRQSFEVPLRKELGYLRKNILTIMHICSNFDFEIRFCRDSYYYSGVIVLN